MKGILQFAVAAAAVFALPGMAQAGAIYDYSGNPALNLDIHFETSLSGASLFNLASGTDITASITAFSISATGVPPINDSAGFPLDINFVSSKSVQIGTDGGGAITSWNIVGTIHASYPVFPGEDPNDFYCLYTLSSSNGLDQTSLTGDHDVGLCRSANFAVRENPGSWDGEITDVPEPLTLSVFGAGMAGGFALRRRKAKG